jgi:hypothetical protein
MYKLVTLLRPEDPDTLVTSALEHTTLPLIVYLTAGEPRLQHERVEWRKISDISFANEFRAKAGHANGGTPGGYDFRKDAMLASHKAFALAHAGQKELIDGHGGSHLIWIDADTKFTAAFDESILGDEDIIHLSRRNMRASDTCFVSFKLDGAGCDMLADLCFIYASGEVFAFSDWSFPFVFDRLLHLHKEHGLNAKDLTPECKTLDALAESPLKFLAREKKGVSTSVATPAGLPPGMKPIKVIPQNCVDDDYIVKNIVENRKNIKQYIVKCKPHTAPAVIVSGGPSAKKRIKQIKAFLAKHPGARVFCVKHSHNWLIEAGIVPFACVLLDPRPIEGTSTHGFKRSDLIAKPHPKVLYVVATMCDPSVVNHLLANGANVIGWSAYCDPAVKVPLPPGDFFVTGGTCAAMRTIGIAHAMGFRHGELYGYDSCWPDDTKLDFEAKDELGRKKYMAISTSPKGKKWWSTGELIAQAQDLMQFLQNMDIDITLNMHGEGVGMELFQALKRPERQDFYKWVKDLRK